MEVEGVGDLPDGFAPVYKSAHQVYLIGVELLRTPQVNAPGSVQHGQLRLLRKPV
jgi:hypothetical protein